MSSDPTSPSSDSSNEIRPSLSRATAHANELPSVDGPITSRPLPTTVVAVDTFVVDSSAVPSGARPEVPGYEVVGELGRGGMGVVYRARQCSLNRLVALKMILAGGHASNTDVARFRAEAEAVAHVQHSGIVQIYEIGEHNGLPYFSLEFCPGASLSKQLDGTPWPPAKAARLVEEVAQAVQAAHDAGLVHRDLKPANVLAGADGRWKVTDFGLAKRLDAAGLTQTGAILGTPSYMAPEQADGRGKSVGPSADVYSLGAIMYELLTGRPPFKAATPLDTVMQVVSQEVVPPGRLVGKLPKDLENICLKCLQKAPGQRYRSAAEFAEDLRRFLDGKPVNARAIGEFEKLGRWCRRNPGSAALVAAVAGSLVLGTFTATLFALKANANAVLALREKRRADDHAAEAAARAEEANRESERAYANSYVSNIRLLQRAWEDNHLDLARELLANTCPEQTGNRDFRDFEWHYWNRLCHTESRTFWGHFRDVSSVAFSPDGKRLASGGGDMTLKLWDVASGKEIFTLKGHSGAITCVAFSPDGKLLASSAMDGLVRLWDAARGQDIRTIRGDTHWVYSIAFSPDGKRLASASIDRTVKVWDVDNGRRVLELPEHLGYVTSVAFSRDGKRLASCTELGALRLWDATTGRPVVTPKGQVGFVRSMAFSNDGKRVVGGCGDGTLKVWNAFNGQEQITLKGHSRDITSVAFGPDDKQLASASRDTTLKIWDAVSGQEIATLKGHVRPVYSVAFSPDGKHLASGGGDGLKLWNASGSRNALTVRGPAGWMSDIIGLSADGKRLASGGDMTLKVWDALSGRQLAIFRGHQSYITTAAFSPDGKRLASGSQDSDIKVWDAASGRERLTFKQHTSYITSLAFSPDSRTVASGSQDGTLIVWDADSGLPAFIRTPVRSRMICVAFSPDGKLIACAGEDTLKVFDWRSGLEALIIRGSAAGRPSAMLAFSPDGKRLAASGYDGTVKLWDMANGQSLLTLKGHTGGVFSVAFSPDGKRLASGGRNMVKVWDAANGQELLTLRGHSKEVHQVLFTPDGKQLLSGSWDDTLRVWDATPLMRQPGLTEPQPLSLQREALALVESLASEFPLTEELVDAVQRERTVSEKIREVALPLAKQRPEDPQTLNGVSWGIVRRANASLQEYRRGLLYAESAVRLAPGEPNILNTLGVAQYRSGQFQAAAETLTRCDRQRKESLPEDLAFLALAQHRLGRKAEAAATLRRLREAMREPDKAKDVDCQAFFREAEAAIAQYGAGVKK